MHTKHPDGFAIQEIREQLLNKTVDIRTLDIETIRALYDYELAWAELDKSDSPTILMELLDVLQQAGEPNDAFDIVSSERCMELAADALAQNERTEQKKRPRKLKKIILIAAAILVLSSIGLTVYASYLGPFEGFVDNIKDLFKIKTGEVLVNGDEELFIDNNIERYDSFESMLDRHQFDILYPTEYPTIGKDSVDLFWVGERLCLSAHYDIGFIRIYITNPPYDETRLKKDLPHTPAYIINELKYYFMPGTDNNLQYALFYKEQLYVICVKTHADFEEIASHIKP